MLGSMYSAVSGLSAHQTKMNVIGNNIANVNTYGFKASRVTFSDVFIKLWVQHHHLPQIKEGLTQHS